MEITEVTTVTSSEFPNLFHLLITSDEGQVGLGETFYAGNSVATYVHDVVAPLILGVDPLERSRINRQLQGYVGYSGSGIETRARSAVDIALWDIAGQAAGMPIFELIGGRVHTSLRAYNTCAGSHYVRAAGQAVSSWGIGQADGRYEDLERAINDPAGLAEDLLEQGTSAMKIWPFDAAAEVNHGRRITTSELKAGLEPVERIRAAVGSDMDILIELHGLWSPLGAREIVAALADYGIFWVEDPIRADFVESLAELRSRTEIPIAVGETMAGKQHFAEALSSGAVDVLTIDVGWCGGLTEALKIVGMAEAYDIAIAPHDCTGPGGLAIATHLSMASSQALVQETVRSSYFGWYGQISSGGPNLTDGRIEPISAPGLGLTLKEEYLAASSTTVRRSQA